MRRERLPDIGPRDIALAADHVLADGASGHWPSLVRRVAVMCSPYLSVQACEKRIASLVARVVRDWPETKLEYEKLPESVREAVNARIMERAVT